MTAGQSMSNVPARGKMQFAALSRGNLTQSQMELIALAELAGVAVQPNVLRILIELLSLNVEPTAIFCMLRDVSGRSRVQRDSSSSSTSRGSRGTKSRNIDKSGHSK